MGWAQSIGDHAFQWIYELSEPAHTPGQGMRSGALTPRSHRASALFNRGFDKLSHRTSTLFNPGFDKLSHRFFYSAQSSGLRQAQPPPPLTLRIACRIF